MHASLPLLLAPALSLSAPAPSRVDALLAAMTLEEKVGQMAQITLDALGTGETPFSNPEPFALDPAKLRRALAEYHVGSILNTAGDRARTLEEWRRILGDIQGAAAKTRLAVPVLYGIDAIHGANYVAGATLFPHPIAQAATFNRALVRRAAEITAYETRAAGIAWNFSPVLDLGADPRFPRQFETFGEDPYLGAELGREAIRGYQGEDPAHPERVAACAKHFLGYQATVSGKDRTPAFISDQALREYHLPAFKAAIAAGAQTVMINSGFINGVPVHASHDILTRLLRRELGFQGLAVTDWGDVDALCNRDRVAKDVKEAAMIAINAGIDLAMLPYDYPAFCANVVALVKEGKIKRERIDEAVRRILAVKSRLGLFDPPAATPKAYPAFGSAESRAAAYAAAAEAVTLLKNDGALPLEAGAKILVAGPNAHSMRALNGAWSYSWQGEKTSAFVTGPTILDALRDRMGKRQVAHVPGVRYQEGGKWFEEEADDLSAAAAAARKADAVILCLGENTYTESPGNLDDLTLSDLQIRLAEKLAAAGKPVILVLNAGRPRVISRIADRMAAIVQVYLPGNSGAEALADILLGKVNPSGRLPYTYPRHPNALGPYYHKPSEAASSNPQFPFGAGLGYAAFAYENLKVGADTLRPAQALDVTLEIRNTGKREGKEAVLLFISDVIGEAITPDVKRLRGFEKIDLAPGEVKTVSFRIRPEDLAAIGPDGKPALGPGEFRIQVGDKTAGFFYAGR